MHRPGVWLAIGALALPPVLLFVLLFAGMAAGPGTNIEDVPSAGAVIVSIYLAAALAATAWLAWQVSRAFLFALIFAATMALVGQIALPACIGQLNRLAGRGPAVVRHTFLLAQEQGRTHLKTGWKTYYAVALADWRTPARRIIYPGTSPVEGGGIVCVDERRGLLGAAWIGGLRNCDLPPQRIVAAAPRDDEHAGNASSGQSLPPGATLDPVAGLPRLALREVDSFDVGNPLAAVLDAEIPGFSFGIAGWFDAQGQVRWLAGAVMPDGAGRVAGIYRSGATRPDCALGLAALASDGTTVWSTHKSHDPAMDTAFPYDMARQRNHIVRLWDRDTCRPRAEWGLADWVLDADADLARGRVALLVATPWSAASGASWPDWVHEHASVELRNLRGDRLWSQALRGLRSPLKAKLHLTPDGLYIQDARGMQPLAGLQDAALRPLPAAAAVPATPQQGWFFDVASGTHWLAGPQGIARYTPAPGPGPATTGLPAESPPRFLWPLDMADTPGWQILAISAQGGSLLAVHAGLLHALLLDTASGHWQVLQHDLRGVQARLSTDGRSLTACTETAAAGRCVQLAAPGGVRFFRP